MLSIPSFNVLRRKTENVNSSPYIVFFLRFFIFSQTMFASTSRYLLFKPYFFPWSWTRGTVFTAFAICKVITFYLWQKIRCQRRKTVAHLQSHLYTKTIHCQASIVRLNVQYNRQITKIHIIFCLFAIHIKVKHIRIAASISFVGFYIAGT